MTTRPTLALLAVAVLTAAGCGSNPANEDSESTTALRSAPNPPAATAQPDTAAEDGLVIDMTIADGTVTPTNAVFDATVQEPIVLRVNSDAVDQLHVHAVPESTFDVRPQPEQTFEVTVEVPGRVEVELHDLGRTVAIIQVRR